MISMIFNESERRKIIPIASGKGGVGKSLLAANLGLLLAGSGRKVTVIDLDLGASNLHTYLGIKNHKLGLGNYFANLETISFSSLISNTPYPNLDFIAGDVLVTGCSEPMQKAREDLISKIATLNSDYVLLDLGPGAGNVVVDFFLIANSGIVVTTPDTTSILNAYSFLKSALFRYLRLQGADNAKALGFFDEICREREPRSTPPMTDILRALEGIAPKLAARLRGDIDNIRPCVVANMLRQPQELKVYDDLRNLARTDLGLEMECLGTICYDESIEEAIRTRKPLVQLEQDNCAAVGFDRISQKLLLSPDFPSMPLDLDTYEDSFALAKLEAENDFGNRGDNEQPEIGREEYLETIAAQKKQIAELQNTVRMLTISNQ